VTTTTNSSKNEEEKEDLLCKYTSENTLKKTSFKQKSLPLKSIDLATHLLYNNDTNAKKTETNNSVVENYMKFLNEQECLNNKSTSTNNNATNESTEEITLNMLDRTTTSTSDNQNDLMPKFLHIDDEEEDNDDECDNIDDIEDDSGSGKIIEIDQNENKNKSKQKFYSLIG